MIRILPLSVCLAKLDFFLKFEFPLVADCPLPANRPGITGTDYSVMVRHQPIVGEIFCTQDNDTAKTYLNLPAGSGSNYGFIESGSSQGSR